MSNKLKELEASMKMATLLYLQELKKTQLNEFIEKTQGKELNKMSFLYKVYFPETESKNKTKQYKELLCKIHPDKNLDNITKSTDAFTKLSNMENNIKAIDYFYLNISSDKLVDLILEYKEDSNIDEDLDLIKREYWYVYMTDPIFRTLYVNKSVNVNNEVKEE
jgi:hypothetical protein